MRIRVNVVALSTLLLLAGNVGAAAFNGLYAFGDSLSDAGSNPSAVISMYKLLGNNCDPLHPCSPIGPYVEGRISNGPVASEHLATALFPEGVTTTNFRSYAVAGASTGIGNSGDEGGATESGQFNLPGMKQELERYMTDSAGAADPDALYFVWGGGNDYVTNDSPLAAAQNISGYVNELAGAGARHFLVPNLSDLSLTPSVRAEGDAARAEAQAFSVVFNTELASQLGQVSSNFPTADIFQFDTYAFLNDVVMNPGDYGFTDVENPCVSLLFSCGNPDAYLHWDDFHPTTRAHAVIASAFASAVPEPRIGAMLIMGLVMVGMVANRRRKSEPLRTTGTGTAGGFRC
ncbi:MAG: SGNH/GDSL hydrolase family protein [Nitrosospira sp.]|nr:SGNH/GDSL hydrolase family protein [Nitrosospira sp.]